MIGRAHAWRGAQVWSIITDRGSPFIGWHYLKGIRDVSSLTASAVTECQCVNETLAQQVSSSGQFSHVTMSTHVTGNVQRLQVFLDSQRCRMLGCPSRRRFPERDFKWYFSLQLLGDCFRTFLQQYKLYSTVTCFARGTDARRQPPPHTHTHPYQEWPSLSVSGQLRANIKDCLAPPFILPATRNANLCHQA